MAWSVSPNKAWGTREFLPGHQHVDVIRSKTPPLVGKNALQLLTSVRQVADLPQEPGPMTRAQSLLMLCA